MKKLAIAAALLGVLALVAYRILSLSSTSEAAPPPSPIKVAALTVEPTRLSAWVFAEGTAEALYKAYLDFERAGRVEYIGRLEDGSPVREGVIVEGPGGEIEKGQLLATLDNRESVAQVDILRAQAQSAAEQREASRARVDMAANNRERAERDFQRIEQVFKQGVVPREEFERVRTVMLNARVEEKAAQSSLQASIAEEKSLAAQINQATVQLEKTSLFAPFDGVVTAMNIREDNYYYPPAGASNNREREAGSAIVVVDTSSYEIQLEVPELDARQIREGQRVLLAQDDRDLYSSVASGVMSRHVINGQVWSVSPSLSLQRRSQLVKVRTTDGDNAMLDGAHVRAWIETVTRENVLVLPWDVFSFKGDRAYVFVINADSTVSRRWIEYGVVGLEHMEITAGLAPGEQVVVRGQHLLTEGTQVEVVGG